MNSFPRFNFENLVNNSSKNEILGRDVFLLLSKAWETYESDKRIEGFSPQTLKAYKLQATLLIRFFKDVKLDTITTVKLKEFLAKSSETLKPCSFLTKEHSKFKALT